MKENFSTLPAECGEKKFSPLKSQILQIFNAKFNAYLKFTENIIEVSDRWRSGIRSSWHAVVGWLEPSVRQFIFCKKSGECGEKTFPPLNSTQILQNFATFAAFNATRCGRFAVKILHYFLIKSRPGHQLVVILPLKYFPLILAALKYSPHYGNFTMIVGSLVIWLSGGRYYGKSQLRIVRIKNNYYNYYYYYYYSYSLITSRSHR